MFSQTTEYALRAMACLALTPDELVSTVELAKQTKVPSNYLAKVLQQLSTANLIGGRRGVGGGYKLARPAAKIRLMDVLAAMGAVKRVHTCPLGLPNHGPNLCPLHRAVDDAAAAAIAVFEGSTLADLLGDGRSSGPLCDAEMTAKLTVSTGKR